ncbi:hypothetical protein PRIPAC_84384 [Pristionchus pacificus]|uniref:Uncharacterized protein n=1 Tax=Pristionchus pacificus TaxID=54126 RepID=A0A2A6BKM7_PRIPA|nr:hypothetical protein PRIPAC_84384 [Pristionchus pacificus]|eukprot:PDM66383.1 hypothetical protein PRIPAC_47800 [Pristionchus pacificus]
MFLKSLLLLLAIVFSLSFAAPHNYGTPNPKLNCTKPERYRRPPPHIISPRIIDYGRCPAGCEPKAWEPIRYIYVDANEEVQEGVLMDAMVASCRPISPFRVISRPSESVPNEVTITRVPLN